MRYFQRLTIVNVARCEHKVNNLAHHVADDMQLEAIEPSHRAFASLGNAPEGLVLEYSLVLAHSQRGAVDKTYADAFAHQHALYKDGQLHDGASFQFNESVVRHRFREKMAHIFAHILKIEMFQTTVPRVMKQDENGHYFGIRHHAIAVILAFLGAIASRYGILVNGFIKNFAEIVTN